MPILCQNEKQKKRFLTSVIKIHSNGLELGQILDSMYAQSLCALSDALLAPHRFAVDQSKCCTPPKLCGVINNSKSWCFEKKEEKKKNLQRFFIIVMQRVLGHRKCTMV